jgi:hypothetical protein
VDRLERRAGVALEARRRPHLDAALDALGEDDARGELRSELRGHGQAVLRVEGVVEGAAEGHGFGAGAGRRGPRFGSASGCAGPRWRSGRSPSAPVRVSRLVLHFLPQSNTLCNQHPTWAQPAPTRNPPMAVVEPSRAVGGRAVERSPVSNPDCGRARCTRACSARGVPSAPCASRFAARLALRGGASPRRPSPSRASPSLRRTRIPARRSAANVSPPCRPWDGSLPAPPEERLAH